MDNPKWSKNNNSNTLPSKIVVSVMITLLTFSALTINPLLVMATGEGKEVEENRDVDNSVSNGNDLSSSSMSPLPSPSPSPSSQQSMNTDIIDGHTSTSAPMLPQPTQSSLQGQS